MKLISLKVGLLMLLASAIICGMESYCYCNVSIWHGNVRLTSDWSDSDGVLVQNFDYADGKHGWVANNRLVLLQHQGKVPWLWCDVRRSGKGFCRIGRKEEATK